MQAKRCSVALFLLITLCLTACGTASHQPTPQPISPSPTEPQPTPTPTTAPLPTSAPTSAPPTPTLTPTSVPAVLPPSPTPSLTPTSLEPTATAQDTAAPTSSPVATATISQSGASQSPTSALAGGADPQLMPGYPVLVPTADQNALLVGNMDTDKTLELVYLTNDPYKYDVVVIKPDGTIVGRSPTLRLASILLGNLSLDNPGLEILATSPAKYHTYVAYTGVGDLLPNWPDFSVPERMDLGSPILADLDGDSVDEVLLPNTLPKKVDGTDVFGHKGFGNSLAVGDIDGDGIPDILSLGNSIPLEAVHSDGTVFGTFVPRAPAYYNSLNPVSHVLGDFYGDGKAETLIVVAELDKDPRTTPRHLEIWSADGIIKAIINPISNSSEDLQALTNSVLALGDLDCDGLPEIVDQTPNNLFVWKADGTLLPGWPQPLENRINASPVIGDVDGDGYADIVTVDNYLLLKAFDRHGNLLPGFPKQFDKGIVVPPVIADFFGDGRNEIAVISDAPLASPLTDANGQPQSRLWLYDLHGKGPYGPAQWGQLRGNPGYQGYYKPQPQPCKP